MHSLRSRFLIAALGIAVAGCNSSQTTAPSNGNGSNIVQTSPDEQVDDIIRKYESLTVAEKTGETGKRLIADLVAIKGDLSEKARTRMAHTVSDHDFAQLGAAIHGGPKGGGGDSFPALAPPGFDPDALKFPDRKTPEGKFPVFPKLPDGKFPEFPKFPDGKFPELLKLPDGKFPELPKFPDGKFPALPKLPDGKFPEFPKLPDLKFPDGPKLPELKLPTDPLKIPDLKLPELPKIPDEGDVLPPPRENPRS